MSEEPSRSNSPKFRRGYGNLIGLVASVVLLLLAGHAYFDYATDDSFISFRYARNLAEGHGLVWNPGERLESYSNFLWVIILSLAYSLGLNIVFTAKVLGILSGVGILILSYYLAHELGKPKVSPYLWIAPLLLAFNRDFLFWMGSGMETAFYALLILASVRRYFAEIRTNDRKPISAVLFFLVAITRPEGIVFYLATIVYDIGYLRRYSRRSYLVFFILFAVYHTWRMVYFGDVFPCPYYAKIGGDERFRAGVQYLSNYFIKYLPCLAVLSLLLLFPPGDPGKCFYLFWLMIVGAGAALYMDGDWMWHFRRMIPATVFLCILMVPAISGILGVARSGDSRIRGLALLIGFLAVHQAVGVSGKDLGHILTGRRLPMSGCLEGELTRAMESLGLWLRARSEPGDLIAVNHAGALPFYADRPALDMTGLCNRPISRLPGGLHKKYDPDYVLSCAPRFVILNTSRRPSDGGYGRDYWEGETALYDHPEFLKQYRPLPEFWTWRWDAVTPNLTYTMVFERVSSLENGSKGD